MDIIHKDYMKFNILGTEVYVYTASYVIAEADGKFYHLGDRLPNLESAMVAWEQLRNTTLSSEEVAQIKTDNSQKEITMASTKTKSTKPKTTKPKSTKTTKKPAKKVTTKATAKPATKSPAKKPTKKASTKSPAKSSTKSPAKKPATKKAPAKKPSLKKPAAKKPTQKSTKAKSTAKPVVSPVVDSTGLVTVTHTEV